MSLRSSFTRISFSLLLTLSLSLLAFADTIRLKDGSIIKGRIISFAGGKFTVAIGEGSRLKQLTYSANEIESISFDSPVDKPQFTATTGTNSGGAMIVNTSSTSPRVITTDNTTSTSPPRVITTDNTTSTSPPHVIATDNTIRTNGTATTAGAAKLQPISWTVKVLADNTANGWTNSGWVLKKGQRIRITGDGQVSLGKGKSSAPAGLGDLPDDQKLLKNVPTGALVAVIGDDNNDFIYIGSEREFMATRDGALFLGINEGSLEDNSGSYNVKIEILTAESN